jgi:hypothetical protein
MIFSELRAGNKRLSFHRKKNLSLLFNLFLFDKNKLISLIKNLFFSLLKKQFLRLNQNEKTRQIETEFDLYIKSRNKIDQDLEYNEILYSSFHH